MEPPTPPPTPAARLAAALDVAEVPWENPAPGHFVTTLPGTRKLTTTCSLVVGEHTLSANAFVVRNPDENHQAVYRRLLELNTRLPGIAFSVDRLGDIYLVGRLDLDAITPLTIDRLLGAVLTASDENFNPLLELGFASAIRREWAWRTKRGESTVNLAAFAHLAAPEVRPDEPPAGAD